MDKTIENLNKKAELYSKETDKIISEVEKVIVGQKDIVKKVVVALFANGHVLLEGMPGLAKTMMINTLANTIDVDFKRLQFTPDLLPADIMGTKIYNQKTGEFTTKKGPIFSNFILADEINRAPPKVQSALLEAMQERQVTISGETHKLEKPFLVLATQNPIETEGTYALPEAQVDRFMFKLHLDYPTDKEEAEILRRMTTGHIPTAEKITTANSILKIQKFVPEIYVDEKIHNYVVKIVHATRDPKKYKIDVEGHLQYGASPRASLWLVLGAKSQALLNSRGYVLPEDVKVIAKDVLRHRILLTYEAEAEGITADEIIDKIISGIKSP
ncbi:AAA domain-containing protein [archaeon]|nr:AAA domain-containing protein [archaeon]